MLQFVSFLLISLHILNFTTAQLLTGYYQISNNHFNFALPAGPKEANLILSFDQEIQYSWAEEYRGEEEQQKQQHQSSKETVEVFGKSIEATLITEQIRFNMFNEGVDTHILLKIIPKEGKEIRGAFSFAFKYNNEDYSLVHYLKKNNLISQLSYSIGHSDSFKAGFVYFGGIHERATIYRKSISCSVDTQYTTWGCQLPQVVINPKKEGPTVYNNAIRAYFQAAENFVYVPKDFYLLINETIFKPILENGKCDIELIDSIEILTCSKSSIEKMPNLVFGFGSKGITVKMLSLFESNSFKNSQRSLIRYKEDRDLWIFGSPFMKQFSMLFNYENSTITIYALDGIEEMKELLNNVDIRFGLAMIMGAVIFIGVSVIIIQKNITRKEDKSSTNPKEKLIK